MNETEHVFPLTEDEKHKLDDLKAEIQHPTARRVHRMIRVHVWTVLALSLTAGVLYGMACRRRN